MVSREGSDIGKRGKKSEGVSFHLRLGVESEWKMMATDDWGVVIISSGPDVRKVDLGSESGLANFNVAWGISVWLGISGELVMGLNEDWRTSS